MHFSRSICACRRKCKERHGDFMNRELFKFIDACPTPFHSAEYVGGLLRDAGFTELRENEEWKLTDGCGYYTVRGGSSLIAFRMPKGKYTGFMISASHSDSPCIKIKEKCRNSGRFYR